MGDADLSFCLLKHHEEAYADPLHAKGAALLPVLGQYTGIVCGSAGIRRCPKHYGFVSLAFALHITVTVEGSPY